MYTVAIWKHDGAKAKWQGLFSTRQLASVAALYAKKLCGLQAKVIPVRTWDCTCGRKQITPIGYIGVCPCCYSYNYPQ